jgi:hypothetical protein
MTTVTIRIGDVMAAQKREEHFAQTDSGVIAPEPGTKKALLEIRGHEEWKQKLEEDWLGSLKTLQQCVCELLLKNQQLRMALMEATSQNCIREVMAHVHRVSQDSMPQ